MKAAIVRGKGQAPAYGAFEEPVAAAGEALVTVAAAALSPLARGRAAGTHYSASARFPFVAGVDGVGRLGDGRRAYFVLPRAPFGAMAERVVVPAAHCVPVPEGLDDVAAAALANPGMSCWAALTERAHLKAGETVLVNGATGAAGRLAVQVAKYLGAARVIATGRNPEALREVAALGADMVLPLGSDEAALGAALEGRFAEGVDVVLDYLWGPSARAILVAAARAAPEAVPIRFVQVGAASGGEIGLPAAVLRSSAIALMGSGLGSIPQIRLVACIGDLLQAAVPGGFAVATRTAALSEVETAWTADDNGRRLVFTMGG